MTRPPGWALVSSAGGIVFVVGGWTAAQAAQPPGYSAVHQTISALARHGLEHRWIMTLGLTGLGLGHVVSALGLSALRPLSRLALAVGGIATLVVVVYAQPYTGSSSVHIAAATTGFVVLALFPAATMTRRAGAPEVIRPPMAIAVSALSSALLIWVGTNRLIGVSERLLVFQQALWPLVLVVSLRVGARRTATIQA